MLHIRHLIVICACAYLLSAALSRRLPLDRRRRINLTRVGRLALTQGTEHNDALEAGFHVFPLGVSCFLFICVLVLETCGTQ